MNKLKEKIASLPGKQILVSQSATVEDNRDFFKDFCNLPGTCDKGRTPKLQPSSPLLSHKRHDLLRRALEQLLSLKHLWYKFWEERIGLDFQSIRFTSPRQAGKIRMEKIFNPILFLIDIISAIVEKPKSIRVNGDYPHQSVIMMQQVLNWFVGLGKITFCQQSNKQLPIFMKNLKNKSAAALFNKQLENYSGQITTTCWSLIGILLYSFELEHILLQDNILQDGQVDYCCKVFFNDLFSQSIENLNKRLAIYYSK